MGTRWALQKGNGKQNISWVSDVYWVSTRWALAILSRSQCVKLNGHVICVLVSWRRHFPHSYPLARGIHHRKRPLIWVCDISSLLGWWRYWNNSLVSRDMWRLAPRVTSPLLCLVHAAKQKANCNLREVKFRAITKVFRLLQMRIYRLRCERHMLLSQVSDCFGNIAHHIGIVNTALIIPMIYRWSCLGWEPVLLCAHIRSPTYCRPVAGALNLVCK